MKIRTMNDLYAARQAGIASLYPAKTKFTVSTATCGLATGARPVLDAVKEEARALGADLIVSQAGCIGFCEVEPVVLVYCAPGLTLVYKEMNAEKARELVREIMKGNAKSEWALCKILVNGTTDGKPAGPSRETARWLELASGIPAIEDVGFYRKQMKIALRNCGFIDPNNIEEYIARGGYTTLHKVLSQMPPERVIGEIKESGLRGRGGAGFPTGMKWEFCRKAPGDEKFIICNADEGDPGAYMDRSILEGDPHSVLEGMIMGAFAIGASQGIIYVRNEYPLAIENLTTAIRTAEARGLLGRDILGSGFSFAIKLSRGAGAFVCGEETSLMASVEGRTGEPRQRPPFPAQKGLWSKPTNINNVETWANVPEILARGGKWYAGIGSEKSKGTKVFSVVGKVKNTGLVEVPMGISLREIVFDIGGGILDGRKFKAVQTGGPSGGCIPERLLDVPVDYEKLTETGAIMGSGGMIVMDDRTCMVDVARYFLDFLKEESCGKCVPCREGIHRMLELLENICQGKGAEGDIELLEDIGAAVKDFSLCALGGTSPNPVLTTIKYFRNEYEAHIKDHKCPAGVCRALISYSISKEKCTGCGACVKVCPAEAISGEKKKPHALSPAKCIKCGACEETCKFGAVLVT
ncbi:MAG: NADH-quinone oxidoreductase subunit NuoF [Planctomycetota bacterium]|nr:NADH-quinone oxidoreductase subunit NuoF [Planctomycetota bacterium]